MSIDPRRRLACTGAYYAAFIGLGLLLSSLGPTLPSLSERIGVSLGALSTVFLARSTGYLAGVLGGGRLFDRFPGHPLLAGMLAIMTVAMIAAPWSPSLLVLSIIFVVLGAAEGALDAGGNTLLTWLYPTGLGPWMNGLHFFFGIGAFLSPLIVGAVLTGFELPVTAAYAALAALLVPIAVWLLCLPSPAIAAHAGPEGPSLRKHRTTIVLVAGLLFATVGAEVGFGNWIYTYAITLELTDDAGAAVLTSAFWGTFTLGRLLGIPLARRWSAATILPLAFVGCGLGALLPLLQPDSLAWVWAGTLLSGLAVAPLFATVLALAGGRMQITGKATGWFFVGSSAGGMTLPWVIGQLFEPVGPTSLFVVAFVNVLVGLAIFGVLATREPNRTESSS